MEDLVYLDNAATTFPKPECVYTTMDKFTRTNGVSLGRGQHILSAKASSIADETRELLLQLFHCSNKKVVFTNTATEALNIILKGINISNGVNIYISPFEHNAVTRTLHYLLQKDDFNIIELNADKKTFTLDADKIKAQFEKNSPFAVIVSHVSNVIGSVAPIEQIFSLAKKYGAITIADMCQSAGLIDTDISSSIYDYIVFAGHKTLYGPLGISGFISSFPQKLEPIIIGGTGIESANQFMPDDIPIKYEAGSHNTTAIAGLNASIKWIQELGIEAVYRKEQENYYKLCEILDSYDNIRYFKPEKHSGVVSCLFDGYSSNEIGQVLSQNNIAVRTGLHCAPYAHKFIGTFPAGTVRFSVSYFNTDAEFEKLNEVLDYINENS
jgi:cysteine desulfurase family protein